MVAADRTGRSADRASVESNERRNRREIGPRKYGELQVNSTSFTGQLAGFSFCFLALIGRRGDVNSQIFHVGLTMRAQCRWGLKDRLPEREPFGLKPELTI